MVLAAARSRGGRLTGYAPRANLARSGSRGTRTLRWMSTCRRITLSAIAMLVGSLVVLTSVAAATTSVPGTQPSRGRVFGAIQGPHGTALVLQPGKAGITVARYLPDG